MYHQYNPASLIFNGVFLPTVAVIAACLRYYGRLSSQHRKLSLDDWVVLPALVLVCAMGGIVVGGAVHGEWGRDGEITVPSWARLTEKLVYILVTIEKPTYGLIKLAFLLFYRRIFTFPLFRKLNEIVIIITCLWTATFFLLEIFICGARPQTLWSGKPDLVKDQCVSQEKILLAFAITDVLGDLVILSMPYPCIEKLRISGRRKLGLAAVFMLGLLAVIAGIIRLGFVSKAYTKGSVAYNGSGKAINSNSTPPVLWTLVEVSVAIVAVCLPLLAPLVRRLPSLSQSTSYLRRANPWGGTKRSSLESVKKGKMGSQETKGSLEGSVHGLVDANTRWEPVVDPQRMMHGKSERAEGLEIV